MNPLAKYMDNYAGHHFQDYSPNPAPSSDLYLYNRPQASGNRGIACVAFALVDDRGNPVNRLNWPHLGHRMIVSIQINLVIFFNAPQSVSRRGSRLATMAP